MCVGMCVCIHACVSVHVCMCVCECACMCVCVCTCACMYVYMCVHVHACMCCVCWGAAYAEGTAPAVTSWQEGRCVLEDAQTPGTRSWGGTVGRTQIGQLCRDWRRVGALSSETRQLFRGLSRQVTWSGASFEAVSLVAVQGMGWGTGVGACRRQEIQGRSFWWPRPGRRQ